LILDDDDNAGNDEERVKQMEEKMHMDNLMTKI
jgi:hypothetical protein